MNNTKKITWYELKQLCNSLTGEELGKNVLLWTNKLEPKYIYKDEPELLEEESVIVEKGHPILLIK